MSGRIGFKYTYELNPIFLTGGIAGSIPGGALPIISLTEPGSFPTGLLGDAILPDPEQAFARWAPLPGSTLIDWEAATYPFANQATAANAMIAQPPTISLQMICPARGAIPWSVKNSIITGLRETLNQHNSMGGLYTVLTPAFTYEGCLLLRVPDVSPGENQHAQSILQFDFKKPLVFLEDAQAVQGNLMNQITGGQQVTGQQPSWSQPGAAGANPTVSTGSIPSAGAPVVSPAPASPVYPGQGPGGSI